LPPTAAQINYGVGRDTIAAVEITAPDTVRAKARLAGAEQWLAGLPALVPELEREWTITVGRPYADATAFNRRAG
jgi:hypothetical protein